MNVLVMGGTRFYGLHLVRQAHLDFQHPYEFEAGIHQTYYWFLAQGLNKKLEHDFTLEDAQLERYG